MCHGPGSLRGLGPHHWFAGDPDGSLSASGPWFPPLSKEEDPQTVS